jgi:hypothetical protein
VQSILVDAGPLIAIFDRRDKYHERAVNFIKAANTPLVTSLAVVTEVVLTLDFSLEAQTSFLKWAHMALDTDRNIVDDLPRIVEIMEKYRNLPADFADASIVALAERVGLRDVATIDNDFSIYRTKSKQRFTNVFPDR